MAFKDLRPNFGSATTTAVLGNCFLGSAVGGGSLVVPYFPEDTFYAEVPHCF